MKMTFLLTLYHSYQQTDTKLDYQTTNNIKSKTYGQVCNKIILLALRYYSAVTSHSKLAHIKFLGLFCSYYARILLFASCFLLFQTVCCKIGSYP